MANINCSPMSSSLALPLCFPSVAAFNPVADFSRIKRSAGLSCISLTRGKSTLACARDETLGKSQKKSKNSISDGDLGVLDHRDNFIRNNDVVGTNHSDRISELTETSGKALDQQTGGSDCEDEKVVSARSFWHNDVEEDGNRSDTTQTTQSSISSSNASSTDILSLGIKEPIYEVIEVNPNGITLKKEISRRQLLKLSGLRLRDIRSVDPSLWVTNSMPSLLVREQVILLNLGSLRAIAMPDNVLVFDYKSKGGQAFLQSLLPRLNPKNTSGAPTMPFELEVVEAALISRTQRLERKLIEMESPVAMLLEVLPNRLTANILEELRLSKQALVELASKAGALRQMLLELLEHPHEIRRMAVLGRSCVVGKVNGSIECSIPLDKQIAEEEEEEIEMLLENYLQRFFYFTLPKCFSLSESCHGHAEQLLNSAKEMEDSIAVNLSSRRLEVSKLELLLQVGTFCTALGALVAGIFGMNLKSYLEEHVLAFWITTIGIILGGIALFLIMYSYLKGRKIL